MLHLFCRSARDQMHKINYQKLSHTINPLKNIWAGAGSIMRLEGNIYMYESFK